MRSCPRLSERVQAGILLKSWKCGTFLPYLYHMSNVNESVFGMDVMKLLDLSPAISVAD